MIENLKTDIIYYCTDTDFEMEFNLCGCCRMRLLTDKADSRNSLAQLLSKAVTRSQIIILCGSLFGDRNLIDTISVLTGIGTEIVDNSKYGLTSDKEITILKGSVPLITSEKVFGGCIIEKNSQTIILLTEDKAIRKQLMVQLLHSYISEVASIAPSQSDNASKTPSVIDVEENAFAENEVTNQVAEEETVEELDSSADSAVEEIIPDINETPIPVAEDIAESEEPIAPVVELIPPVEEQIPALEEKESETVVEELPEKTEPDVTDDIKVEEEELSQPTKEVATDEDFLLEIDESDKINIIKVEPNLVEIPEEKFADLYITSEENLEEEIVEEKEEKSKFKGAIIVLLILVGLIVLALLYLMILRPIISGENLSEYLMNLFYESTSSELAVKVLH